MDIICPECGFTRQVPDEKIPERSVLATCPKCAHKFRFRKIDPLAFAPEDAQGPETTVQPRPAQAPAASQVDAQGENGLVPPAAPGEGETAAAPPASQAPAPPTPDEPAAPSAPGGSSDIWQKLEDLGDKHQNQERPRENGSYSFRPESVPPAGGDRASVEIPFENLEKHGFFKGIMETIKRVMLHPGLFFSSIPLTGGHGKPLVFHVLLLEFSALFQIIWQYVGADFLLRFTGGEIDPGSAPSMIAVLFVAPLFFAGGLYIYTSITHLLLMIFGAARGGYEASLRAMAYSSAPYAISVFPVLGYLVGWIWAITALVIGLKNVHQTTYWRVIPALLLPFALLMALALLGILAPPDITAPTTF